MLDVALVACEDDGQHGPRVLGGIHNVVERMALPMGFTLGSSMCASSMKSTPPGAPFGSCPFMHFLSSVAAPTSASTLAASSPIDKACFALSLTKASESRAPISCSSLPNTSRATVVFPVLLLRYPLCARRLVSRDGVDHEGMMGGRTAAKRGGAFEAPSVMRTHAAPSV
eukprot:7376238-Prymnesium_polylepis.1